jgi:hypothetical protein
MQRYFPQTASTPLHLYYRLVEFLGHKSMAFMNCQALLWWSTHDTRTLCIHVDNVACGNNRWDCSSRKPMHNHIKSDCGAIVFKVFGLGEKLCRSGHNYKMQNVFHNAHLSEFTKAQCPRLISVKFNVAQLPTYSRPRLFIYLVSFWC